MKIENKWINRHYLGKRQLDGEDIYLSAPSWDCNWYWGFGYLGNKGCHYHLDGISGREDLHTGLQEHFGSSIRIRPSDLWVFAELIQTFYNLKTTTEMLKGSAGLTNNPCKDIISNPEEIDRINQIVLPAVFNEIYELLERNSDNEELFKTLVQIDNAGLTSDTLAFMKSNKIIPDDLKIEEDDENYNHKYIEGFTSKDVTRIHSAYWKDYHSNKN